MSPRVSIIMPSYNHGNYIKDAIDSVLSQTYTDWTLTIVDDGSSDDSQEIIETYCQKYPRKINCRTRPQGENKGIAATYRTALDFKKESDFVAFLESDDVWEADSLETKVRGMETFKHVLLAYTDVELFGADVPHRRKMEEYVRVWARNLPSGKPFRAFDLSFINIIPTFSCVIVRRKALEGLDFSVPDEYAKWLDRWLWVQIAIKGQFLYIPERKTRWRFHSESFNYQAKQSIGNTVIAGSRFNKQLQKMIWDSLRKRRQFIKMILLKIYVKWRS